MKKLIAVLLVAVLALTLFAGCGGGSGSLGGGGSGSGSSNNSGNSGNSGGNGNELWQKKLGDDLGMDYFFAIAPADGGYVAAGTFSEASIYISDFSYLDRYGRQDGIVIKLG